jgi:hypothetical protein
VTTQLNVPQLDFSQYADWLKWRAGRFTAGPPQLLSQYGIQLEDWRIKPIASLYGLAEITGIPALIRWGQAVLQNRPIAEVEKEYYQRIANELQQAGIGVSEEAMRRRVEQAAMHAAAAALPLAVPTSRAEAVALAKSLGVGFGFVGAPTAFIRTAQGHPDETLKAFIETGLAGTVLTDAALILRNLAAGATPEALAAVRRQIAQQQRRLAGWRDPEETFVKEIEETLLALKQGDTSKYDKLLRQFEEWHAKIEEFRKLYEARQKGQLTPEDEARYTKLLKEVSEIRDKYDLLKQYIDAARELGLEAGARRAELEARTISDLANAAQAAPPGPPQKDLMQWLLRLDYDLLQKLVKNPQRLAKYARRFGVDEQTLAERAALLLRERQWENLANLPDSELKKILMDEALLKKYASEFNISEDALRTRLEELLQQHMGVKPPESPPEKPPIEPIRRPELSKPPETQFRPPETEVETRGGQVLIVRPEEEPRLTVRRLEDLPSAEARLRYLLRRRRLDEETARDWNRLRSEVDQQKLRKETPNKTRDEAPSKTRDEETSVETGKTRDETPGKTKDEAPSKTVDETPGKTVDRTVEREVVVLDRNTLRMFIPALPAYVFTLPVPMVLAMISRAVGTPIALAPGLPKPSPRESFANWLDRVYSGSGFSWRSLAAQRETFVFA